MDSKYKKGDIVIVKFRLSPAWPAKVDSVEPKGKSLIYNVTFFNTKETGKCRISELSSFQENKQKQFFGKKVQSESLRLAIKEAEELIKNNNTPRKSLLSNSVLENGVQQTPTLNCSFKAQNYEPGADSTGEEEQAGSLGSYQIPKESCSSLPSSLNSTPISAVASEISVELVESLPNAPSKESSSKLKDNNLNKSSEENRLFSCLSLLKGEWLTDEHIDIYMKLVESVVEQKHKMYFMSPAISQAIKCLEDTKSIELSLDFFDKSYIFVPVNDAPAFDYNSKNNGFGSHWSLLLFSKPENKFYYFDSTKSYNLTSAKKTVEKLSKYLSNFDELEMEVCKSPQQPNSKDCGIYVILIIEILVKHIKSQPSGRLNMILPSFSETDVWSKRCQLSSIVCNIQTSYATMRKHCLQTMNTLIEHVSSQAIQSKVTKSYSINESTQGNKQNPNHKEEEDFRLVTQKTTKKFTLVKENYPQQPNIPLRNRFNVLNNVKGEENVQNNNIHKLKETKEHHAPRASNKSNKTHEKKESLPFTRLTSILTAWVETWHRS